MKMKRKENLLLMALACAFRYTFVFSSDSNKFLEIVFPIQNGVYGIWNNYGNLQVPVAYKDKKAASAWSYEENLWTLRCAMFT